MLFRSVCFTIFSLKNPFYIQDESILQIWKGATLSLSFWCDFIKYLFTGIYIYFQSVWELLASDKFFYNMITYFNPTEYTCLKTYVDNKEISIGVKFLGSIWFLLGKALIPYGIFEVVQAFRKYNKID